jgi:hypothetical protein
MIAAVCLSRVGHYTAHQENLEAAVTDLTLRAVHYSGANGVECALDGVDQIVDNKTSQEEASRTTLTP